MSKYGGGIPLGEKFLRGLHLPLHPDRLAKRLTQLVQIEQGEKLRKLALETAGISFRPTEIIDSVKGLRERCTDLGRQLDEAQNTIVAKQRALEEANKVSQARADELAILQNVADGYMIIIQGTERELAECKDGIQRRDRRIAEKDKDILTLVTLARQLSQMVAQLQKRVSDLLEGDKDKTERICFLAKLFEIATDPAFSPQQEELMNLMSAMESRRVSKDWLVEARGDNIDNATIPAVPETILAFVEILEEQGLNDTRDSGVPAPAENPAVDLSAGSSGRDIISQHC
jgi:chromosome segregation ATPase